ncbi:hypothetical protein [Serinicoccus profundi]|nr:hypothetical protein [Serinicoccus profundi]
MTARDGLGLAPTTAQAVAAAYPSPSRRSGRVPQQDRVHEG